jgi:hypothetical protein
MVFIHIQKILRSICDSMDETEGYHIKWNEPDTERQIVHDIISMYNVKRLNS